MKSSLIFGLIIVVLIGVCAVYLISNQNNNPASNVTGKVVDSDSTDIQRVVLSMKNGNYYPNTIKVKVGQPVSISLDNSVGGCYRTVVINKLGLRKTFQSSTDTLDFTPKEKGTYEFACSMRMGVGTLIVE